MLTEKIDRFHQSMMCQYKQLSKAAKIWEDYTKAIDEAESINAKFALIVGMENEIENLKKITVVEAIC